MLFAKTAIVVVGDLGDTMGSNTGPLIQEKAETILICRKHIPFRRNLTPLIMCDYYYQSI